MAGRARLFTPGPGLNRAAAKWASVRVDWCEKWKTEREKCSLALGWSHESGTRGPRGGFIWGGGDSVLLLGLWHRLLAGGQWRLWTVYMADTNNTDRRDRCQCDWGRTVTCVRIFVDDNKENTKWMQGCFITCQDSFLHFHSKNLDTPPEYMEPDWMWWCACHAVRRYLKRYQNKSASFREMEVGKTVQNTSNIHQIQPRCKNNNVYCGRDRKVWLQTLIYDAFILKFKSQVYETKASLRILGSFIS